MQDLIVAPFRGACYWIRRYRVTSLSGIPLRIYLEPTYHEEDDPEVSRHPLDLQPAEKPDRRRERHDRVQRRQEQRHDLQPDRIRVPAGEERQGYRRQQWPRRDTKKSLLLLLLVEDVEPVVVRSHDPIGELLLEFFAVGQELALKFDGLTSKNWIRIRNIKVPEKFCPLPSILWKFWTLLQCSPAPFTLGFD